MKQMRPLLLNQCFHVVASIARFQWLISYVQNVVDIRPLIFRAAVLSTLLLGYLPLSAVAAAPTSTDWNGSECIGINKDCTPKKFHPGHYMLVYLDSAQSKFSTIYDNPKFLGVQVRYKWKDLEPTKNNYNFSQIESDLALLEANGKRLVIQLLDVTFGNRPPNVPDYILNDPEYDGGVVPRRGSGGWIPKRWNTNITARYNALIAALGKRFDREPYVEAVASEETAASMDCNTAGYTNEGYRDSLISSMNASREAFPNTVTIIYTNYFPCGGGNQGMLKDLFNHAEQIGMGLGGPDLYLYSTSLNEKVWPVFRELRGKVPRGVAVQTPDFRQTHPDGSPVTAEDMLRFGMEDLRLDYIFWLRKNPEFFDEVIPAVSSF